MTTSRKPHLRGAFRLKITEIETREKLVQHGFNWLAWNSAQAAKVVENCPSLLNARRLQVVDRVALITKKSIRVDHNSLSKVLLKVNWTQRRLQK
jgi:hypothetical protein